MTRSTARTNRPGGQTARAALAGLLAIVFAQPYACAQPGTAPPAGGRAKLEARLVAPAGLKVAPFATNLGYVRFMALGPDGAVYASQPAQSRVIRIADVNGDGVADSVTEVVTGLNRPHGLAFHKGWLYIANTDGVVRVRVGPSGRPAGTAETVNRFSGGGGHWTRTVIFGPDSGMYVAIGSTCNLCVEQSPDRAAVMRFDEDGSNGKLFSSGLRNAVGMAVNPQTGEIWVSQNERDNLPPDHENLPPEEINILRAGGDYGWPYCYSLRGQAVPNPEYNDAQRCSATVPAALEMQAHSAPLGMSFLSRATQLPAEYRTDLLVAFHGSWNRGAPTGAKVVRVRVQNGKPAGYEDFLTGWQLPDGSRWGRPADVLVYGDGSVLVSDDASGAIFRVFR